MRLAKHFITFHNTLNKFNNTGALMLGSTYHHDIKITLKWHFWCEKVKTMILGQNFFIS